MPTMALGLASQAQAKNGLGFVCLFYSDFTSRSTIFQSYRDGVWMWQGAQCSLLECCLTEISRPDT